MTTTYAALKKRMERGERREDLGLGFWRKYQLWRWGSCDGSKTFKNSSSSIDITNSPIAYRISKEVNDLAGDFNTLKSKTDVTLNNIQEEINKKRIELDDMLRKYPGINSSFTEQHSDLQAIIDVTTNEQNRLKVDSKDPRRVEDKGILWRNYLYSAHEMQDAKNKKFGVMEKELKTIKTCLTDLTKLIDKKKQTITEFSSDFDAVFNQLNKELRYYFNTAVKKAKSHVRPRFPFQDVNSMLSMHEIPRPIFTKKNENADGINVKEILWSSSDDDYCKKIGKLIETKETERQTEKNSSETGLERLTRGGMDHVF
jgi:archaellum component FlaC